MIPPRRGRRPGHKLSRRSRPGCHRLLRPAGNRNPAHTRGSPTPRHCRQSPSPGRSIDSCFPVHREAPLAYTRKSARHRFQEHSRRGRHLPPPHTAPRTWSARLRRSGRTQRRCHRVDSQHHMAVHSHKPRPGNQPARSSDTRRCTPARTRFGRCHTPKQRAGLRTRLAPHPSKKLLVVPDRVPVRHTPRRAIV